MTLKEKCGVHASRAQVRLYVPGVLPPRSTPRQSANSQSSALPALAERVMVRLSTALDLSACSSQQAGSPRVLGPVSPIDRRLEAWLVSQLEPSGGARPAASDDWLRRPEDAKASRKPRNSPRKHLRTTNGWLRIRVEARNDLALVQILGTMLLSEQHLDDLGRELRELTRAGCTRLVLDFSSIQRMTSRLVGVVLTLKRLCEAEPGGQVRLCGLNPEIAAVFGLSGLTNAIGIYPDRAAATAAPWPARDALRPLPVSILAILRERTRAPGLPCETHLSPSGPFSLLTQPLGVVTVTTRRTRRLTISSRGIVIGREKGCHFRLKDRQVSRLHAVIQTRQGQPVLKDLGSLNGTYLNRIRVRGTCVPLRAGDEIRVGGHTLQVFADADAAPDIGASEDDILHWVMPAPDPATDLNVHEPESRESGSTGDTLTDNEDQGAEHHRFMSVDQISGVQVVRPLVRSLDDDLAIDALRDALEVVPARDAPPRIVLDLRSVAEISGRAIGLILAHHMRIGRVGGSVRLSQLSTPVQMLLQRIRLPLVIDCFDTVDDAVLDAWE